MFLQISPDANINVSLAIGITRNPKEVIFWFHEITVIPRETLPGIELYSDFVIVKDSYLLFNEVCKWMDSSTFKKESSDEVINYEYDEDSRRFVLNSKTYQP